MIRFLCHLARSGALFAAAGVIVTSALAGNIDENLPDSITWKIEITPRTKDSHPVPVLEKPVSITGIEVRRAKPYQHIIRTYRTGGKVEEWWYHPTRETLVQFTKNHHPRRGGYVIQVFDIQDAVHGFPNFPELSWIDAENHFLGTQSLGGTDCFVYGEPSGTKNEDGTPLYNKLVFVESATKRPLLLVQPDQVWAYSFTSGPARLSLPADIQKAYDEQIQQAANNLIFRGKLP